MLGEAEPGRGASSQITRDGETPDDPVRRAAISRARRPTGSARQPQRAARLPAVVVVAEPAATLARAVPAFAPLALLRGGRRSTTNFCE